jgi:hypothetical protein
MNATPPLPSPRTLLSDPKALGAQHTFESLFCECFHCAPADYERKAFRKCLYWRARFLAPFILRFKPDFFAEDFSFIQLVGKATSLQEVCAEAWRWRGGRQVPHSFSRSRGQIRVSGRKAVRLARELFQRDAYREKRVQGPARPSNFSRQVRAGAPS